MEMWEKLKQRHPRVCDAMEAFMFGASVVMLAMAIDLYILIRAFYA